MFAYGGICGDITYAYGVFLPFMSETFGWSRSTLSAPYTFYLILGGMLGPLAGLSISKFGARKNIVFGNIIGAAGLLAMSQVQAVWHVYFSFGILAGLGLAFAEFLPVTTLINSWFIRKRSLALGFVFASGGLCGFLMPPIISALITAGGWRSTWIAVAVIHVILTVILAGFLIRNKPEDLRQTPDGVSYADAERDNSILTMENVQSLHPDWTLLEALRSPALWILIALYSFILFAGSMMITHQVAYLEDIHYSPMVSATALGLMLGVSVLGRLLSGVLAMRYEARYLGAVFMASTAAGIVSLLNAHGIVMVYIYSALTGIGFGGMIVLLPNMMGAYFGRTHFPQILGWTAPFVTIFSSTSPMFAGFLFDLTGSYFLPFTIAAILLFSSSFLALLARPPK